MSGFGSAQRDPVTSGQPADGRNADAQATVFSYRRLLLLGFGFMGVQLLWAIYNAYLPIYLQAGRPDYAADAGVTGFGLSPRSTGIVMTLDNLAALFILPYVGAVSDRMRTRWGRRKPFIAVAAPIAAVSFAVVPFMLGGSLMWFLAAVIVTLLAMDVLRTPVVSLMPDTTPSEQRSQANGVINLMGGLGSVVALSVGGSLFAISHEAPFLFAAFGLCVGVGTILMFVREPQLGPPPPATRAHSLIGSLLQVIRDPDRSALRILIAIFFWSLSQAAIDVFATSFAVNELGQDSGSAAHTMSFFFMSCLGFSVPAGAIGAKFGRRRTVLVSIWALAALLLYCSSVESIVMFRVLLVVMGAAWTTIVVQALPMVVDCTSIERVGTFTGLYYVASQSAGVLGPIAAGQAIQMLDNSYRVMFPGCAVALALAFLAMWGVRGGEARRALRSTAP